MASSDHSCGKNDCFCVSSVGSVIRLKRGPSSATFDPTRVTQLSSKPRAFLYKGFLSEEECNHLINLAPKDKRKASMVKDKNSENGEGLQIILHYDHGQKYAPHYDSSSDKADQELGGHRVATLMETIEAKDGILYDSAKKGFSVKPIKGDALLFFNLLPDATIDQNSVHGSCPVIEGEKWAATKWLHVRAFQNFIPKVAGARG
ncbi:hypothetical protein ACLB2K_054088 [Fragaria x ananassa]